MFQRFTGRARRSMTNASEEAQRAGEAYIDTHHILLGLLLEGTGSGTNALKNAGVSLDKLRATLADIVKPPPESQATATPVPGPSARRLLERAVWEAQRGGHSFVGTEHLTLALLADPNTTAARALTRLGLDLSALREKLIDLADLRLEPPTLTGQPDDPTPGPNLHTPLIAAVDELSRRKMTAARNGRGDLAEECSNLADQVIQVIKRLQALEHK
jgi:ATP-dependent Clp protease ATP-binding subunit ClpC